MMFLPYFQAKQYPAHKGKIQFISTDQTLDYSRVFLLHKIQTSDMLEVCEKPELLLLHSFLQ